MNELHRLFAEALAQSGLDVAALDESDLCQLLQSKIIPECATSTLDELRRRAPDMLRERRAMEEGFRSRNFERWAQGFDLLEMLIVIADETGEAINNADRPMAVRENDAQFESVVTLHARSVLVAREILCLLKNGFADGALGRWRTLHEVAVVTQFLAKNEKNTSERYLLHRTIQSHKAMLQYRKYQEAANLEPFDEYDVREITETRNKIIAEYGGEMIHN